MFVDEDKSKDNKDAWPGGANEEDHLFCANFYDKGAVLMWSTSCLLTEKQKEGSNKKVCQSNANCPLAGIRTGYIVSKFDNVWVGPCTEV